MVVDHNGGEYQARMNPRAIAASGCAILLVIVALPAIRSKREEAFQES
jgi:hypothetical protein